MEDIGKNIFKARKKRGLSQNELAEKVGVSQSAINQWETGKRIPKAQTIFRLSYALSCTPKELMSVFDVESDFLYTVNDIFSEIKKRMKEKQKAEIEAKEKGIYLEAIEARGIAKELCDILECFGQGGE